MMHESEYVFAYGSNMDPAQIRERCPESDLSWFIAEAKGWELCFPRRSQKRKGGVASIRKADDSSVWGVIFGVTPRDLQRLDGFEGVALGSYRRDRIDVKNQEGIPYKVWTYFANPQGGEKYRPHEDYMELLIKGAKYFELPGDYIGKLKSIKTKKGRKTKLRTGRQN